MQYTTVVTPIPYHAQFDAHTPHPVPSHGNMTFVKSVLPLKFLSPQIESSLVNGISGKVRIIFLVHLQRTDTREH